MLYFSAKNTKTQFKHSTDSSQFGPFLNQIGVSLHQLLDFDLILPNNLWLDIGKETCLSIPQATNDAYKHIPQVYLWRRCCLGHYLQWLYNKSPPKSHQTYYQNNMLYEAVDFTSLTPPTSRLRRGSLLYSQFYSTTKEPLDAAKHFPFQNTYLRELALGPYLQAAARCIIGSSAQKVVSLEQAYLATKVRYYTALTASRGKAYGTREEHRISWTQFQSLHTFSQVQGPATLPGPSEVSGTLSCIWIIPTLTFFDFAWYNSNKFAAGFKLIRTYTLQQHVTRWEQVKMMDMFLYCLQYAAGSYNYRRASPLWWNHRSIPNRNAQDLETLYYGLSSSVTLPQYSYCWLQPLFNWSCLAFQPGLTNYTLFGTGHLHQNYKHA
ncbi:uncharacterized protein HMPREF1541_02916 [Cyphellophora europaea CBS 101466]|uniref:Uncharacterized protein n=1 Tax=Cyphellophora europaea (strain CBS 101466) TaxID=1220924 RepID=W2S4Z3_CYPE1|nr:uncharacterized protein HMPREF1541_02916 [Cyphellophora europaea CBS 101466]ETN43757.1 hypothetical protein HMPREF1541_02916 [Cyphellophora europaea CBS 101466]